MNVVLSDETKDIDPERVLQNAADSSDKNVQFCQKGEWGQKVVHL